MSWPVLLLVLISTVTHTVWNLQAKQARDRRLFLWWVVAAGAVGFSPVALYGIARHPPSAEALLCIVASGLVYCAYFPLTALSYERADLSHAYPIARGVGPLLSVLWGVWFFAERPTGTGWVGIGLVLAGLALLAWAPEGARKGIAAAVGTGLCVSLYSAIDKRGVSLWEPSSYIVCTYAAGALGWGLVIARDIGPRKMARYAQAHAGSIALGAVLCLGGYLLVLMALTQAPMSYVIPIRSASVLLTVLAGTRLLQEGDVARRVAAAFGIVAGVILIALQR